VLAGNLAHVNSSNTNFGLFSHCQSNLMKYDNVQLYNYKISCINYDTYIPDNIVYDNVVIFVYE
jgi:hypothetical protein